MNYLQSKLILLLTGLENKWHIVFFDSCYASISLAKELNSRRFYIISILRQNTKNFPEKNLIENSSKLYAFDNKDNIIIQKYVDKKDIFFISIFLGTTEEKRNSYNLENRGVDKFNQNISYYNVSRGSKKWWKKIFFLWLK